MDGTKILNAIEMLEEEVLVYNELGTKFTGDGQPGMCSLKRRRPCSPPPQQMSLSSAVLDRCCSRSYCESTRQCLVLPFD